MLHQAGAALGGRCTERTVSGRRVPPLRESGGRAIAIAVVVLLGAQACDGGRRDETAAGRPGERAGGARAAATAGDAAARSTAAKPICPATGQWQICSVLERLERAGLAPRRDSGQVTEAPLASPGIAIQLGRSELRVFLYADRAARERDGARLDRTKYLSAVEPLSMKLEPTLITSENMLAILRSRSDHQRERVSDALTAGPPQKP